MEKLLIAGAVFIMAFISAGPGFAGSVIDCDMGYKLEDVDVIVVGNVVSVSDINGNYDIGEIKSGQKEICFYTEGYDERCFSTKKLSKGVCLSRIRATCGTTTCYECSCNGLCYSSELKRKECENNCSSVPEPEPRGNRN